MIGGFAQDLRVNHRINPLKPFRTNSDSKDGERTELSKSFERHFVIKMLKKNQNKIIASVIILMIQSLVHIMTSLLDIENDGIYWPTAIMEIVNILAIILYISFTRSTTFIDYPFLPKIYLGVLYSSRYICRIVEIWSFNNNEKK